MHNFSFSSFFISIYKSVKIKNDRVCHIIWADVCVFLTRFMFFTFCFDSQGNPTIAGYRDCDRITCKCLNCRIHLSHTVITVLCKI